MIQRSEAFLAGYDAFWNGKEFYDNPYPPGNAAADWGDGFETAAHDKHLVLPASPEEGHFTMLAKLPVGIVSLGRLKETEEGPWEPAIMMMNETDMGNCIIAISVLHGKVYKQIWDYYLQTEKGCFSVPDTFKKNLPDKSK